MTQNTFTSGNNNSAFHPPPQAKSKTKCRTMQFDKTAVVSNVTTVVYGNITIYRLLLLRAQPILFENGKPSYLTCATHTYVCVYTRVYTHTYR